MKGLGSGSSSGGSFNMGKATEVFNKYKDHGTGQIEMEGLGAFWQDAGGPDLMPFYLSFKMNAANFGQYTQKEFTDGFRAMGVSTMEELKKRVPQLSNDMKAPDEFKKMYKFIYHFARDKSNKNLQMEMAVDQWNTLLKDRCRFLNLWIAFLTEEKKDLKVVTKDTWDMIYELNETTKGDLSAFVDDGSWPPIIDGFIAYFNAKQGAK